MTKPLIPSYPLDSLLTTGDVAKVLGVSLRTVQLWSASGTLTCVVTPGGHRRIRLSEVRRLQHEMAYAPPATLAVGKEAQQITVLRGQLDAARAALKTIANDTRFVPNYHGQHEFVVNLASTALASLR